jgi:hypothetical protein
MAIDAYWRAYDATLARVRADQPKSFAALKLILDVFQERSSGDAFFPDGADDTLAEALEDAGWEVQFYERRYLYRAEHPATGALLSYVEGDLYEGEAL